MGAISSAAERPGPDAEPAAMAAALKRLYAAYIARRLERAAIAALRSLSDRELADIGLARSEIADAVRTGSRQDRPRTEA